MRMDGESLMWHVHQATVQRVQLTRTRLLTRTERPPRLRCIMARTGDITRPALRQTDAVLVWQQGGDAPVAPIDLHSYIDTILPSGYCSTGDAVTDKIESFIDKTISNGSVVSVQFASTNTASSPTLTVNGVKAPILDAGGQPVSPSALGAGRRLFLYSSASPTGWILLNPQTATLPTATAEDAGKAAIVGENGQYDLAYPKCPW